MPSVAQVLGYKGQRLGLLGGDEFVTVQGTGLLVTNVEQGLPSDMIWRSESGVGCFAWYGAGSRLAIAPAFGSTAVEVVEYGSKSPGAWSSASLTVPGTARIIDMVFSRNGERLFALSDASDSMVLCWDVVMGTLLFSSPLNSAVYNKVIINPGNDMMLCIFGNHGIQVGVISDVLGVFTVRFEALYIEPEYRFEESEVSTEVRSAAVVMANAITCAIWVPFDHLLVTNLQGNILEVPVVVGSGGETLLHVSNKSSLKRLAAFGDSSATVMHATNIAMGNATLIVCTSVGIVFWFQTHSFSHVPDSAIVDCTTPLQIANADGYISALAIDPTFQRLIIGTFPGQILRLPVDIQERPTDENATGDDVEGGFQTDAQAKVDDTPLVVAGETVGSHQSGAVVCSASMAIPNSINKKHLPLLVLGSQEGMLSFWLYPLGVDSSSSGILGVPSLLTSVHLGTPADADSTVVVCSMAALPFRRKGNGQLLCVGLDSGLLQIWEVTSDFSPGDNVDEAGHRLSTKCIASRRFYTSPLTTITASTFSPPSSSTLRYCLAVASSSENCVHVVQVFNTMDAYAFDVQCVLKLENTLLPASLIWNGPSICICASNGSVFKFAIEAMNASEVSADLIYPTPQMSFTPPGQQQPLALIQSHLLNSDTLVGIAAGSSFLLTVSLKQDAQASIVVVPGSSHSDALIVLAKCPNNKFLATGCADGSIHVWRVEKEISFSLVNRMDLHTGPIVNLAFSSDSSLLFSASADGSYFLSNVEKSTMNEPVIMKLNEMGTTDPEFITPMADSSMTWMEQKRERLDQELKEKNSSKSSSVDAAISELSIRLHSLLDENADRSDLEKMDRAEFVVDLTGQESINEENERRVAFVRNSYFKLNAWNELIAARVRQTCWDSMAAQSRCLLPLLDDVQNESFSVSSMPVRKCSEEEILSLERVKRLRAIEVRSQQKDSQGSVTKLPSGKSRCTWSKSIQGCPEVVSWISFDGARWPCSDVIEMIAEREKEDAAKTGKTETLEAEEAEVSLVEDDEGSQTADAAREVDDNDVINLLYPPQCVRTQTQKRMQIILLKEVGRLIRAKFNVHFDKLVREKEDALSSVESRNLRIRAILEELKQDDEYLDPKWKEAEVAGSAITVTDDEVVSRPYESEVQRAARVREEEERRRREAEKDKEDVKGRALDEMMHGTLEVKRDVFAEASSLQRPVWMDEVAHADMTEAQLKEMDAFEVRFKMLQEEQAKYRKTLEVELKKLKAEAIEVCKAFDEKLVGMVKLRVHVQREILSQELYISRISQSMAQRDQLWQLLTKNETVIKSTRVQRNELRSKIDTFNVEVEGVRAKLALAQEEERTMEKGFKRDIQNLCNVSFDQDQLKVFNQLYHIRVYPTVEEKDDEAEESEILKSDTKAGGIKGKSPGKDKPKDSSSIEAKGTLGDSQEFSADSVRDPFFYALLQLHRKKKLAEAEIPLMYPLDMATECPESIEMDQFMWSKLQELRNARIEKEIECTLLSREYGELKRKLDQLCSEEAVILTCLKDLVAIKEEMSSKLSSLENNLIVLVSVKQGQDEVDREAIVTDYTMAALVPVEVIRKFNGRIKEHGREKIGVLNRIKQFRRKINILDWEAKHLSLESHHFEEYYTDLQLLRVTRELQHVIRDGSNAEQAKVRAGLLRTKSHISMLTYVLSISPSPPPSLHNKIKARIDRVGARKDFLQKDAEERIRKLKQSNEALRRLVKGRTDESNSLHEKIQKLVGEVDARQSVLQSRDDARGTTGNPSATAQLKMKKVMARRQLADTARAQAEEIDFLRQELDRMRQRTFPSFVRSTAKRTGGM